MKVCCRATEICSSGETATEGAVLSTSPHGDDGGSHVMR